jgi:hypothetical protein
MTTGTHAAAALTERGNTSIDQLIVHWVKARIDEPLELIERYDSAARQLISLGGVLQGAYVGIFAIGEMKSKAPLPLVATLFGLLLLVVFAATFAICQFQKELNAYGAFQLVQALTPENAGAAVEEEMRHWCEAVDRLARSKHFWLRLSTSALMLSFVAAGVLLSKLMKF